jgi:site-specific DNA-methyltransferase (cytosine-N4-specific)
VPLATAQSFASLRVEDRSWDYRGEFTKQLTHGFHSYPAMMIPQVARRLIERYSEPGATVLDPFCGSGSVLVEARFLGRNAWGVDLNPLALLIARAKTTPIAPERLAQAYAGIRARLYSAAAQAAAIPQFFNLDYWFKPAVALQLARIKRAIEDVAGAYGDAVSEFFLVPFSETVRLCSNSRSHEFKLYRYPPAKLRAHNPDAAALFREKAEKNVERMAEFYQAAQENPAVWCRTLLADATAPLPIPEGAVDVVVTSPPYGDSRTTVAYGQFSRLSAQWLGFADEAVRNLDSSLMGGRALPTLSHALPAPSLDEALHQIAAIDPARARQVLSFYDDLAKALANVARLLRPGGYACIVIGNRRVKRVQLPTDLIIAELGAALGLVPQEIFVRNIPSKTMPLKNSPTNVAGALEPTIHREYVVVLKKGGAA